MGKYILHKKELKKTEISVIISNEVDFRARNFTRQIFHDEKEGQFIK